MSCEICGRSSCTRSFHSIHAQKEHDAIQNEDAWCCDGCGCVFEKSVHPAGWQSSQPVCYGCANPD